MSVTMFIVDVSNNYESTPRVVLFPRNAAAAGVMSNLWNNGNIQYMINLQTTAALAASTVYEWDYLAIQ